MMLTSGFAFDRYRACWPKNGWMIFAKEASITKTIQSGEFALKIKLLPGIDLLG